MAPKPLMVIGHKNPDTDSICSAIAYAYLKSEFFEEDAQPYRAGNLNKQTIFALSEFEVQSPDLLIDVYPKISDIMIGAEQLITLTEDQTLGTAQRILTENRFAFLPVTDSKNICAGKITAIRLAGLIREIPELAKGEVAISVDEFIKSTGATFVNKPLTHFLGKLRIDLPSLLRDDKPGSSSSFTIVGSGSEAVSQALDRGDSIVVSCGGAAIGGKELKKARANGVSLIQCPLDPLDTLLNVFLAMPLQDFIQREHPTFQVHERVRDVQREVGKYNEGGFIVLDESGLIRGVITRISFLTQNKFRVVLVDHNEYSQAVDGIEDANVIEIIDHHRLGNRATDSPITFINKVVGSTATIIAEIFNTRGLKPPRNVAGLLLSAILSDTVILKSPTAGKLDREMAEWLTPLADVGLEEYGNRMFAAGSELGDLEPARIIKQDQKLYTQGEWRFSISQIEIVGFPHFYEMQSQLSQSLEEIREGQGCDFSLLMVTDITQETSLLLCSGSRKVLDAITYSRIEEGLYELRNVLSRKKQVLPYVLDLLQHL